MEAELVRTLLSALRPVDTYRDVADRLERDGWAPCGAGDWARAFEAPGGAIVARISPFDPVGPYTAQLYRAAAHTSQVPRLYAHRRLAGPAAVRHRLARPGPGGRADSGAGAPVHGGYPDDVLGAVAAWGAG